MPTRSVRTAHRIMHHTLGVCEYDTFYKWQNQFVFARAIMTSENCVAETERLIAAALHLTSESWIGPRFGGL
jgi:indolepyruvate decarboxylase